MINPKIIHLLLFLTLTVTLRAAEQRIVSLTPALTELVCQLGCEARLVGRSEVCDYPATVKKLPVAGRFADPDVETVIALKPTLLLANDLVNPGVAATFRKAGIETRMIQCRNIAEYRACVETLGQLLGAEAAARTELARIDREQSVTPSALPLNVLWVVWDAPLMIAGASSLPDEVIRRTGAANVAANVPQAYFKCSFDWLLERKIDAVVWMASPNGWHKHRFWSKLDAVRRGRIIADLNPDLVQRPGPRIFDGIRELRRKLEVMREK